MTSLDFSQPPFDVLSPVERQSLKKHTQVRYLGKGEALTHDEYAYFYVVLKGRVQQQLADDYIGEFAASAFSNDWFDARQSINESDAYKLSSERSAMHAASPAHHASHYTSPQANPHRDNRLPAKDAKVTPIPADHYSYSALEESLLLQIDGAAIDRLSAQNHHIRQLLSGELSERLQALNRRKRMGTTAGKSLNSTHALSTPETEATHPLQRETQQIMLQPVTTIPLLPVHMVAASDSLFTAAQTMTAAGLKHVLVRRQPSVERHPTKGQESHIGILTDADICRAVSESVDMNATLCGDYAKFKLRTIAHQQDVSEALLTMIRYRVHRLPVTGADGEIIGILGQSDLLAFLNQHSQLISVQIEQAVNVGMLHDAVEQIGQYIRAQQQNGIKIGVISRMVQTLNAQVFTKLWRLLVPEMIFENTCVIVMGSEGRGEQIMRTDQDNALIIRNGFSHPQLAEFAEQFNQTLADMGYPLCDGNIMMTNPIWRQPLGRFKNQISSWFEVREPIHSVWLSALLDAAYVCGDERLLDSLRTHLQVAHKNADPMFVRNFARAALQFGDVSQWWKKFAPLIGKPASQDVDLKKAGLFPLVHGIRAIALEQDILAVTSSKGRLTALVQAGVFTELRAETLNEALEFFMGLRLGVALTNDDKFARQVDPSTLSALERDLLKECLNVVKSFKNELRQRYQLEVS